MQRQSHDNMLAVTVMNALRIKSQLKKQAFQMLTPLTFQKFKKEYSKSNQYLIFVMDGYDFILSYYEGVNNQNHKSFRMKRLQCVVTF